MTLTTDTDENSSMLCTHTFLYTAAKYGSRVEAMADDTPS